MPVHWMRTPSFLPVEIGRAPISVALINLPVPVLIHEALQIPTTEPHAPAKPDLWDLPLAHPVASDPRCKPEVCCRLFDCHEGAGVQAEDRTANADRCCDVAHCSGRGVVACSSCKACLQFHKMSWLRRAFVSPKRLADGQHSRGPSYTCGSCLRAGRTSKLRREILPKRNLRSFVRRSL
jgi:hypothetical protein